MHLLRQLSNPVGGFGPRRRQSWFESSRPDLTGKLSNLPYPLRRLLAAGSNAMAPRGPLGATRVYAMLRIGAAMSNEDSRARSRMRQSRSAYRYASERWLPRRSGAGSRGASFARVNRRSTTARELGRPGSTRFRSTMRSSEPSRERSNPPPSTFNPRVAGSIPARPTREVPANAPLRRGACYLETPRSAGVATEVATGLWPKSSTRCAAGSRIDYAFSTNPYCIRLCGHVPPRPDPARHETFRPGEYVFCRSAAARAARSATSRARRARPARPGHSAVRSLVAKISIGP
jgi:hypothetical protein